MRRVLNFLAVVIALAVLIGFGYVLYEAWEWFAYSLSDYISKIR